MSDTKKDPLAVRKEDPKNTGPSPLLPLTISLIAIVPSTTVGILLKDHTIPVQYVYFVAITILLLAVFNFATVVMIEEHRETLGKATVPALVSATAIIFMFVIAESFNRFVYDLGYAYITPFLFVVILFNYGAIFKEKHYLLKFYMSLNTVALFILWAMGNAETFTTPF